MEQIYSTSRILRAQKQHLEDIVRVTQESFRQYQAELGNSPLTPALTESRDNVLSDIENNHVIIAEEEGKVVGAIRFQLLSPDIAYIYRFGVISDQTNTGIGTRLIEAAVKEIQNSGASIITLHTNSKYYKLARYYYGKGFYVHSTSTKKGYIRALFIKELTKSAEQIDLTPALQQ